VAAVYAVSMSSKKGRIAVLPLLLALALAVHTACAQQPVYRSLADEVVSEATYFWATVRLDGTCGPLPPLILAPNIDVPVEWRLASVFAMDAFWKLNEDIKHRCIVNTFGLPATIASANDPSTVELLLGNGKSLLSIDKDELDRNRRFTKEMAVETARVVSRLKYYGSTDQMHATMRLLELAVRKAITSRPDLLKALEDRERPSKELVESRVRVKTMLQQVGAGKP
jgi:hypothetical protein